MTDFFIHVGGSLLTSVVVAGSALGFYAWQKAARFRNTVGFIAQRIFDISHLREPLSIGQQEQELEKLIELLKKEFDRVDATVLRPNIRIELELSTLSQKAKDWSARFRQQSPDALRLHGQVMGFFGTHDPEYIAFNQFVTALARAAENISALSFFELS